jgi:hypothetical protein
VSRHLGYQPRSAPSLPAPVGGRDS